MFSAASSEPKQPKYQIHGWWATKRPNAKATQQNCQILRLVDFILSRIMSLSAASKRWQSEWPLYQDRPAAVAVLSKPMAVLARPNGRPAARFTNQKRPNGSRGLPTPYDPMQRNYQRPAQATSSRKRPNDRFIKASFDGRFIKASPMAILSRGAELLVYQGRFANFS